MDTHVAWSSFLQEMMTINTSPLINLWLTLLTGVTNTALVENQHSLSFQCYALDVPEWVSISYMHCHLCLISSANWWVNNISQNINVTSQVLQNVSVVWGYRTYWQCDEVYGEILPLKSHYYFISLLHHPLSYLQLKIWILLFWIGCDSWGVN